MANDNPLERLRTSLTAFTARVDSIQSDVTLLQRAVDALTTELRRKLDSLDRRLSELDAAVSPSPADDAPKHCGGASCARSRPRNVYGVCGCSCQLCCIAEVLARYPR